MEGRVPLNRATAGVLGLSLFLLSPLSRAAEPTKQECVEANESAQDLQRARKLHDARTKLALCVAQSCPGPVREDCAARLQDVDKAMPSIVFEFKDANGDEVPGVAVSVDGAALVDHLGGGALPVDPGEHTFTFDAAGRTTERKLVVVEGVKLRREVIVLGAPAPATSPPTAQRSETTTGTPANGGGGTMRLLSFVAGGVGVVGLGIGIGAGVAATSKHSTLEGECPHAPSCPTSASGDLDSFHTLRTASTVSYVIGAVGLVGGGVLYLTAPSVKASAATAWIRPWLGLGSAGLSGRF
jgi:hypothetical protein